MSTDSPIESLPDEMWEINSRQAHKAMSEAFSALEKVTPEEHSDLLSDMVAKVMQAIMADCDWRFTKGWNTALQLAAGIDGISAAARAEILTKKLKMGRCSVEDLKKKQNDG